MKLKRILVVDDSNATAQINKALIESLDVSENIDCVKSGTEALQYLEGKNHDGNAPRPDLILLDIEMPDMSGFEFLDAYSQLGAKYHSKERTVIAILSEHLDVENYTKSKEYKMIGVLDHIRKPLEKEDIENLLEDYFD